MRLKKTVANKREITIANDCKRHVLYPICHGRFLVLQVKKGGKRHATTVKTTKVGARTITPKKGVVLADYRKNQAISKNINRRNESRASTLAQRTTSSNKLKNKDLKRADAGEELK